MEKQRTQMLERFEKEIELGSRPIRADSILSVGQVTIMSDHLYLIASTVHKRPRFTVQLHLGAIQPHPIHKPYDLPISQHYNFKHGVHQLWVYFKDKPLSRNSPTFPRTEIRIRGYDYSSGVWQFEGYGYVPCGTANVTIMQVFGASSHATTLMLIVGSNGTLTYYRTAVLDPYIYDRWFRVNVIHYVYASHLKVYIDGVLKFEGAGRGGKFHYFKCGVYSQPDGSYYMESRWKGIKVLKKCD